MTLSQTEIFRYSRQLPIIGLKGQLKLKNASVVCIGSGGLGCPLLQYIVAAGIGNITIVDFDKVELSNLARQILFKEGELNQPKASTAAAHLTHLNPHVKITSINKKLNQDNISEIIKNCDVVIDGCDNFDTRYLINRYCRAQQLPLIAASIFKSEAQISTFNLADGPCYECLYPTPPKANAIPNCALGGVLGALPGMIGSIQALEAIKIITGIGETLSGFVLTVDSMTMDFKKFQLSKSKHCTKHQCAKEPHMILDKLFNKKAEIITATELNKMLQSDKDIVLIDVREAFECEICKIEGSTHIPLAELKQKAVALDQNKKYIIYCKAGIRGNKGALTLIKLGFNHVYNLEGGILKWIDEVDNNLMKY